MIVFNSTSGIRPMAGDGRRKTELPTPRPGFVRVGRLSVAHARHDEK